MAHYAFLDENNIVTNVIVGLDEGGEEDWEQIYGHRHGQICKRTSYNMRDGVHLLGKTPFRRNYAVIGGYYSEELDAFVPPKPFESWLLSNEKYIWEPPTEYPNDGQRYIWSDGDYQNTGNGWILSEEI